MAIMNTAQTEQFLLFRRNDAERLINASDVIEVIPMVHLRKEHDDQENPRYAGLLDYRGKVVPVFDLIADPASQLEIENFLIVMHHAGKLAAVIATGVDDLVTLAGEQLTHIQVSADKYIDVGKTEDRVIKILSAGELL